MPSRQDRKGIAEGPHHRVPARVRWSRSVASAGSATSRSRLERREFRLFCDDWAQASHGGELASAVKDGLVTRERVTDLAAVLTGERPGRQDATDVTLFDSTGLAIQDLAVTLAALERVDELDLPQLHL